MEGVGRVRGEGEKKEIEMCYVHAPAPHEDCDGFIWQTWTNKK